MNDRTVDFTGTDKNQIPRGKLVGFSFNTIGDIAA